MTVVVLFHGHIFLSPQAQGMLLLEIIFSINFYAVFTS